MNQPSKHDYDRVCAQYRIIKQVKEEMEANPLYQREIPQQPNQESNTVNTTTYISDSKPPVSPRQAAVNVVGFSIWIFFGGCMLYLFGGLARWW